MRFSGFMAFVALDAVVIMAAPAVPGTASTQPATNAFVNHDFYVNNKLQGKDKYPHPFHNRPQRSTNDFINMFEGPTAPIVFPNCPSGTILEYPLMRDTTKMKNYTPGQTSNKPGKNNPDRVIFTSDSPTGATYCGVITHDGIDDAQLFTGDFLSCHPLF